MDVGGEYGILFIIIHFLLPIDPARHRYDHHQRGFTETMTIGAKEYNTKLSSAGLIYK